MDALILRAVRRALAPLVCGATVEGLRAEEPLRLRLSFARDGRTRSLLIDVDPERPWLGRARALRRARQGRLAGAAARMALPLVGRRIEALEQPGGGRVARMGFSGGLALWFRLLPGRGNALLVDAEGRLLQAARTPPGERERLVPGRPWDPPGLPPGRVALEAPPSEIDAALGRAGGDWRRALAGLSRGSADRLAAEAAASGEGAGATCARVLAGIDRGERLPAIVDGRLVAWATAGELALAHAERDAAHTVGGHEVERTRHRELTRRLRGARSILERRVARLQNALERVESDLAAFEDPRRHRLDGEALLAGVHAARRDGAAWRVPDPYVEGAFRRVSAEPGASPAAAAEKAFARHRRAERGLVAARARREELRATLARLADLARQEAAGPEETLAALERGMRAEGIPVGFEERTRSDRAPRAPARLEGVRLFLSRDGYEILVGKGGKQNDRLTFKLAGPEDFWLHALGVPGAHVVVRNPERERSLPEATLRQAATLAAWFSDAREQTAADVQWTRRRFVRRARGRPPGTVLVKRAQTIRVAPREPS